MNTEEMRTTEGGFFFLVVLAIIAVIGVAVALGAPVQFE
jgi:hypothetical protein